MPGDLQSLELLRRTIGNPAALYLRISSSKSTRSALVANMGNQGRWPVPVGPANRVPPPAAWPPMIYRNRRIMNCWSIFPPRLRFFDADSLACGFEIGSYSVLMVSGHTDWRCILRRVGCNAQMDSPSRIAPAKPIRRMGAHF